MNQQQKMILKILEDELCFEFNEDIINSLLENKANFFSMPRQCGKTYHIMAATIIIALTDDNNKITIYTNNYQSINVYNYRIYNVLEKLDMVKNYTFISNNNYSIHNIKNNKIEIESKINSYSYIGESDYIFIDEIYTIEYKTKYTVKKLLEQSNKSVNIFTTLPMKCRKILKTFYKLNFNFKFVKNEDNDILNNYDTYQSKDFIKSQILGKIIP